MKDSGNCTGVIGSDGHRKRGYSITRESGSLEGGKPTRGSNGETDLLKS